MHRTTWQSLTNTTGAHEEISWEQFRDFIASPVVAASKNELKGWSPAKFTNNRRTAKDAELVSCIALDDDESGLPIERVNEIYAGVSGLVHTSHSSTPEAPKYRVVLRCSRDMSPDEHARVWRWCAAEAAKRGQTLDEATKDVSRLWFAPSHREGTLYEWRELAGEPLPVDEILAAVPEQAPAATATAERTATPVAPDARRKAAAATLGAVWPLKGRHLAQLALAGGLVHDGWSDDDATAFLRETCRFAGNEEPTKRATTVRHTLAKQAAGEPFTGWSTLAEHIDPAVVQHVRDLLGGTTAIEARLAEVAARIVAPPAASDAGIVEVDGVRFKVGGFDAPQPAIPYQVGPFIARGEVDMLVAQGNSLKTWLAFSIALAVATGRPWLGQYVVLRGRVGILDFESGDYEIVRRLKILGVKDSDIGDRLLRCSYPGHDKLDLAKPESWVKLAALKLDMLIWDSFAAASRGQDENDARVAEMLQHAGEFADATVCTVVVIHHARKGAGGDQREIVRGSSALYAACDRVFKFDEPEKKDDGIVLTTMRPIKDGAGRRPPAVRVELSDQGLRWVEMAAEPVEEEPTEAVFRRKMIDLVERSTSGVNRERLIDAMPGTKTKRREIVKRVLAELLNDGVLTECKIGKQVLYVRNSIVAA
jgi:hypothetical protein